MIIQCVSFKWQNDIILPVEQEFKSSFYGKFGLDIEIQINPKNGQVMMLVYQLYE